MKCENCHKQISILKRVRHRFFHAIDYKYSRNGLLRWEGNVYFCSTKCIAEYEWTHPSARILN